MLDGEEYYAIGLLNYLSASIDKYRPSTRDTYKDGLVAGREAGLTSTLLTSRQATVLKVITGVDTKTILGTQIQTPYLEEESIDADTIETIEE